ncbi:MAG: hypothetical protein Q7V05_11710 [Methanoregula sp.]|nr:hypothetical protein [Methanoregula sp.]
MALAAADNPQLSNIRVANNCHTKIAADPDLPFTVSTTFQGMVFYENPGHD